MANSEIRVRAMWKHSRVAQRISMGNGKFESRYWDCIGLLLYNYTISFVTLPEYHAQTCFDNSVGDYVTIDPLASSAVKRGCVVGDYTLTLELSRDKLIRREPLGKLYPPKAVTALIDSARSRTVTKKVALKSVLPKYELCEPHTSRNIFARDKRKKTTLYRVRALIDIPMRDIKAGDLGGWVQSTANLSQTGMCWIHNNAVVMGNAYVGEDAHVYDNAVLCDNARAVDAAHIQNNARISGNAKICGNAVVEDNAKVAGDTTVSGDSIIKNKVGIQGRAEIDDCQISDQVQIYSARSGTGVMLFSSRISDNVGIYGTVRASHCTIRNTTFIQGTGRQGICMDNVLLEARSIVMGNDVDIVDSELHGDSKIKGSFIVVKDALIPEADVTGKHARVLASLPAGAVVCDNAKIKTHGDCITLHGVLSAPITAYLSADSVPRVVWNSRPYKLDKYIAACTRLTKNGEMEVNVLAVHKRVAAFVEEHFKSR